MTNGLLTSSDNALVRRLDPSEELHASYGSFVGYCVRIDGDIDVTAMRRAFNELQKIHPILATRIVRLGEGRHGIRTQSAWMQPAYVTVVETDTQQPLDELRLRQQDQVGAVHIVRGAAGASVSLLIHHSIADRRQSLTLLAQLWAAYTEIDTRERVDNRKAPSPCPAAGRFLRTQECTRAMATSDQDVDITAVNLAVPTQDPAAAEYMRLWLSPGQTAQLTANARAHNTSISGIISAALILVEAEVRGIDIAHIFYLYNVDLRLRPGEHFDTAGATNMAWFTSASGAECNGRGLYEIARHLDCKLESELEQSPIAQLLPSMSMSLFGESLEVALLPTDGAFTSTSWVRVPELLAPHSCSLTDLQPASYQQSRTSQAPPTAGTNINDSAYITVFNGALSIDFVVANQPVRAAARATTAQRLITTALADTEAVNDDN